MFKKLFARLRAPKNNGEKAISLQGPRWVKSYDVILSNMEGSPSYPLSHQLSIGSEIGNIIIADPSVSPRHASILLQEEVISIIDHGSVAGTFVNGTKIPAGKFIILEDSDKIKVGDLEVKIGLKTSAVENTGFAPPGHDHLEEDEEIEVEDEETEEEDEEEEEEKEPELEKSITRSKLYAPPTNKAGVKALGSKKKAKISFSLPSYDATNSLIRVFALTADFLLSYIILVIFLPFDDFRAFLDSIPVLISEALDIEWKNIWVLIQGEIPQVTEAASEIYGLLNDIVPVLPLVLIFFLLRLVTTVIFSVSISEFIFGITGNFNKIWARIGGLLRVIIGMITGPFLIFDLPALASKRTFKEFITLTNTFVNSRVLTFFGIVLYLPLLAVVILISPMVVGLEVVEPIPFNSNINQRAKARIPVEGEAPIQKIEERSRYLGFTLSYDPAVISLIPSFKFQGVKSKLNMKGSLEIFHRDNERLVTIELFKTFDLKELLQIGFRGNFLLQDQYQSIYNFAYSQQNTNRLFKLPENVKQEEMFGKQVVEFTEVAMGLSVDNVLEFMTTKTPFIKSVVDYRHSLLNLFEYKDFSEISVIKLGKLICLRLTYDKQKPFDLIMPLLRGEGRIYKISYDNKVEINQLRNKFYKFTLDQLLWGVPKEAEPKDTFTAMDVLDIFTMDMEKSSLTAEKGQALYGYYFEKSADVMKAGHMAEFEIWKNSVKNLMTVIPHLREPVVQAPVEEVTPPEDLKTKLKSNFSDLFDALENLNKSFFGIEAQPTV